MVRSFECAIEVVISATYELEQCMHPCWVNNLVPIWGHLITDEVECEVGVLEEEG